MPLRSLGLSFFGVSSLAVDEAADDLGLLSIPADANLGPFATLDFESVTLGPSGRGC